jgi:hypothetical protein
VRCPLHATASVVVRRPVKILGAVLATVMFAACGDSQPREAVLGDETDAEQIRRARDERRIAELERRAAALREAERRERTVRAREAPGRADLGGFESLAADLGGDVGITLGPVGSGEIARFGNLGGGSAWSTIKVALAARAIHDRGGPDQISAAERALIESALTASDNGAAEQLWSGLVGRHGGAAGAAAAVREILQAAGDGSTVVSTQGRDGFSPYGQTDWSLEGQHRFMAALAGGCLDPSVGGDYLLEVMGRVISAQRWGLGSTGVAARFKGGWGPGTDGRYLVRQIGVLATSEGPLVVTLAALPADGSFASGAAMLDRLADWAAERGAPLAGNAGC